MQSSQTLEATLRKHAADFHPVIRFDSSRDRLHPFDFTSGNTELAPELISDTELFACYIKGKLKENGARFGIGGYNEHRTLYARSRHFDAVRSGHNYPEVETIATEEHRRLHLGIDIWGQEGTGVYCPLDGIVHSFAFNNNDSDYGATIILTHNLDGVHFHTLYGHLSLNSLKNLYAGERVYRGMVLSEFGMRFENGNWPPHLHFQIIGDMDNWEGDYPGVCKYSEREAWLANSPDPDIILQLNKYI